MLASVLALGLTIGAPTPAYAAGDQIDSYDIKYQMQRSGVLNVQERITYRFGDSSGRHGIERSFVTREPYEPPEGTPDQGAQDAVYTVDQIDVDSPDDVSTRISSRTTEARGGREQQLVVRIGDPNETISLPTATYVISYQVRGAMRSFPGSDEFFWDATGLDWKAAIRRVTIAATVPGGAQQLSCFYGAAQSKAVCSNKIVGGVGQFSQSNLAPGQGVSIGVKIKAGLVTDNKPHLEPDASQLSTGEKAGIAAAGVTGVASLVGAPLLGLFWWRRNGRDQRYAGLPPGTVPLAGQPAQVVTNDPDLPIPVAFSPPKIPVAEAGLLIDGQVDTRETAATIIDLAVRGALSVSSSSEDDFSVTLLDPGLATAPHEMVLMTRLFDGGVPGTVVDLSSPGTLQPAHLAMRDSVISQVAERGWFRKVPSAAAAQGIGFGGIA
ncbi:MAG TPA: DUF2207 domain-containing protein, partial [Propionibacteriaceae bacterium]